MTWLLHILVTPHWESLGGLADQAVCPEKPDLRGSLGQAVGGVGQLLPTGATWWALPFSKGADQEGGLLGGEWGD